MIVSVISDLHLGVGNSNEFFREEGLTSFLNSIPDRSLILDGDIFELLKDDSLSSIIEQWKELVPLLFAKALAYVIGNHDRSMANSSFSSPQFMGVPVMRYLILGDTMFTHGDMFDITNNDSNHALGDTVTGMVGWLAEHISPQVNALSRELEKAIRSIGRNGDPVHYRNSALAFVEHFIADWERPSRIVLGHTHQPDYEKRNDRWEYFNTGCFMGEQTDVTQLEIKEEL